MGGENWSESRRQFLWATAAAGASTLFGSREAKADVKRKMTIDLRPGSLGHGKISQPDAVALAQKNGFESVEPQAAFFKAMSDSQIQEFLSDLRSKGLVLSAGGMPVEFRQDDAAFQTGMKTLPDIAKSLQRAGVTRMGTWLKPSHPTLTYLQNFKQHADRLGEVAKVLNDHGIRFGLEYVGPKTAWTAAMYPFIHTLKETQELIAAIPTKNVGLIMDSWHWYHAGETKEDLLGLKNEEIVAVDLNDAPAGIEKDQMNDLKRELPAATGIIDVGTFLNALNAIGYDGPVRAEPFVARLGKLSKEEAIAETGVAMKKAFALVQ